MLETLRNFRTLGSLQNGLSALIFGFLALAHASAVLLGMGVRNEWSWFVSIHLNRLAAPALDAFYKYTAAGPFIGLFLLALLCAFPIWAQLRRNWLATSTAGHLALGMSILLLLASLQQAQPHVQSASLEGFPIKYATLTNAMTWLVLTGVMVVLCLINHLAFFGPKSTDPQPSES